MIDNDEKELIAQFMEWEIIPEAHGVGRRYRDTSIDKGMIWFLDEFKFHYSWDWLMPVVEKIRSLKVSDAEYDEKTKTEFRKMREHILSLPIHSPIDRVHDEVSKFAKWYNENKKA